MNYKSVILIRYDGKNQEKDLVFGIGLEFSNKVWNIINTSENIFSEQNVIGVIQHALNKFKNKNYIILHNGNKDLVKILKKHNYNNTNFYNVLSDKLKQEYSFMKNIYKINSKGPRLNSTKNMSIDVSFFYRNFMRKTVNSNQVLKSKLIQTFFSNYQVTNLTII